MTYSVFITTKYIKDNSPTLDYVNDDELRTVIRPAQDVHIERILGTRLYRRLQNRIEANTLNSDDRELLIQYIQPALMYWTIYEWLLLGHYKLTNKSVTKQASDNSTAAELSEVRALKSSIMDWAEYYNQRITNYLWDNVNTFPEYREATGWSEQVARKNNYLFGGMYIPPSRLDMYCPDPAPWHYIDIRR